MKITPKLVESHTYNFKTKIAKIGLVQLKKECITTLFHHSLFIVTM